MLNYKLLKRIVVFTFLWILLISIGCAHQVKKEFISATISLNTPELIDKYQRKNFSYATTSEGYGCGGVDISISTRGCYPDYIFISKKGNCAASTKFATYCLKQAGYEAYPIKIYSKWPSSFVPGAWPRDYHYMALFKDNNKW